MGILYPLGHMLIADVTQSYPDTLPDVPLAEKDCIIIHHTATAGRLNVAQLYAAHKQYGGIGYHAIVQPDGRAIMVGRWNTSRAGAAQTPWLNWRSYHVALVGNFTTSAPPAVQLDTTRQLLAELQYARGARLPIVPHCLFNVEEGTERAKFNTGCPGDTWVTWFGRLLE